MSTITKREWTNKKTGKKGVAWTLAYTDNRGKRCKPQFASKREAEAARTEIEHKLSNGTYRSEAAHKTVLDASEIYLDRLSVRMSKGYVLRHYYECEKSHVKNYILTNPNSSVSFQAGIGHIKLRLCTPKSLQDFLDDMDRECVSTNTQRNVLSTLGRVLKCAVGQDWIAVKPTAELGVETRREDELTAVTPPTKHAFRLLLEFSDPALEFAISFSGSTGVRACEQHVLIWKDFDLEHGSVYITRARDRFGKIGPPKTKAGVRTIPLGLRMTQRLRRHRAETKYSSDGDPVFPNRLGGYMNHHNFMARRFKPLQEIISEFEMKNGRQHKSTTWHANRHFAISSWIEAGLSPKTVQTFAGHSSLKTTMDRYGHLFPSESHNRAMDKIADDLFANGAKMEHKARQSDENRFQPAVNHGESA